MSIKKLLLVLVIATIVIAGCVLGYSLIFGIPEDLTFDEQMHAGYKMITSEDDSLWTKNVYSFTKENNTYTVQEIRNGTNADTSLKIEKNGIAYNYPNILIKRNGQLYINSDQMFNLIEDNKYRIFGSEEFAGKYIPLPTITELSTNSKQMLLDKASEQYSVTNRVYNADPNYQCYETTNEDIVLFLETIKDEVELKRLSFAEGVNEKKERYVYSDYGTSLLLISSRLLPSPLSSLLVSDNSTNYGQQVFDFVSEMLDKHIDEIRKTKAVFYETATYTPASIGTTQSFVYRNVLRDKDGSLFSLVVSGTTLEETTKLCTADIEDTVPFAYFVNKMGTNITESEHYCFDSPDFPYTYSLFNDGRGIVFRQENDRFTEDVAFEFDEDGIYNVVVSYATNDYAIHELLVNYYTGKYYTINTNDTKAIAGGGKGELSCVTDALSEISTRLYDVKTPEALYDIMCLKYMPLYAETTY